MKPNVKSKPLHWRYLWLVSLVALIAGCSRYDGPQIFADWSQPKPGIREGTLVRCQGVEVGIVKKVPPTGPGTVAEIRLIKKLTTAVPKDSTAIVRVGAAPEQTFIEILPGSPQAGPVQEGAHLRGVNSELESKVLNLVTDWKRLGLYLLGGLVAVVALVLIVRVLFKLWAVLVCAAGGGLSAVFLTPYIATYVAQYVPADLRPEWLSYVVAFLAGYIAITILLAIFKAPLRSGRSG